MDNDLHSEENKQDSGHEEHGEHAHPSFLHHHFETPKQQFESDKMGMWLFLTTEVLLFAGLFCAYSIYRGNHPEVFIYAHHFLDKTLGGINTLVLIFSSLTMAWAVRASQLGQQRVLVVMLGITILCAFAFLGIKYIEYEHKIKHGLLWGSHYSPGEHEAESVHDASEAEPGHEVAGAEPGHEPAEAEGRAGVSPAIPVDRGRDARATPSPGEDGPGSADPGIAGIQPAIAGMMPALPASGMPVTEPSKIAPSAVGPRGLKLPSEGSGEIPYGVEPKNVQTFFAVYFTMTGLHGIHVLAGIVVLIGLLVLSLKGTYGPAYFTPVELTGLYWHLVDLIWIFLFPLFYLIG